MVLIFDGWIENRIWWETDLGICVLNFSYIHMHTENFKFGAPQSFETTTY